MACISRGLKCARTGLTCLTATRIGLSRSLAYADHVPHDKETRGIRVGDDEEFLYGDPRDDISNVAALGVKD